MTTLPTATFAPPTDAEIAALLRDARVARLLDEALTKTPAPEATEPATCDFSVGDYLKYLDDAQD